MAINKVVADGETKLDLTGDTITAADLKSGVTAHDRSGAAITGSVETYTGETSITPGESAQTLQTEGKYMDSNISVAAAPSGGSSAAQYSATLAASGWTESGGYQTQTVAVSGLSASYEVNPDVDCQLSGTDADGDAEILNAWALVSLCETGDGTLTAKCIGDAPAANIPITVRVFE